MAVAVAAWSPVIIFTSMPARRQSAMASRAHAIVMKGAPLADLGAAVARVVSGETFYCRRTSELLRRGATQPSPLAALTPREREILALVARGSSSPRIAATLGISEKTVQNHRANLMDKLGIRDVASLTRFAIAQGVVGADEAPRGRAGGPARSGPAPRRGKQG